MTSNQKQQLQIANEYISLGNKLRRLGNEDEAQSYYKSAARTLERAGLR